MKSPLQVRAEAAAEKLRPRQRRPIVIEFAGVPKAGKTTTLNAVQSFLKRCGFRVEVVVERASVCPIRDKKHANFNVWTACTTLAQILEKTQDPPRPDDPQILILDRGLFDSICWLGMMQRLARIKSNDRNLLERFLLTDDWRTRVNGVVLMTASPEDAMKREKGHLPVEGATGSIMNHEVLSQMKEMAETTAERLKHLFRVFRIDTSSGPTKNDPAKTSEAAAEIALTLIEEEIQERVLFLPKSDIEMVFGSMPSVDAEGATILSDAFTNKGQFKPRDEVESNDSVVQALPVVVVRNQTGHILRLRRREASEQASLHKKVVLWAGGHVREEDRASEPSAVLRSCAVRELEEELRLSVEPASLRLLGAVYIGGGGKVSKHAAIVYEWRAESDDVEVALSNSEFFERRGTSLSGSFVDLAEIETSLEKGEVDEPWSAEIVREFLSKGSARIQPRLL